mmetsp:Transcript_51805/g.165842  ORF Transcript_51805/g.165842 Transcript_51805/m.165842 type:complete len:216 (-) Transcript_51805:357-1004(-)
MRLGRLCLRLPVRDLQRRRPGGREKRAGVVRSKLAAEEVLHPPLPQQLLLLHEAAQGLEVGRAGHGWHETLGLLAAVGEAGVEDRLQQAPLLRRQPGASTGSEAPPEGAAGGEGVAAAGNLLRQRRGLVEVEPVKIEVHTLHLPLVRGVNLEDVQAEGDAAVEAVRALAHALLPVEDLAVLHLDRGVAALVPELRDLQGAAALCLLLGRLEPRIL